MSKAFHNLFEKQAAAYARFRPGYPRELFTFIASQTEHHERVWDCGTGNGQAAVVLAELFDSVVATDVSAAQIELAIPRPNVQYRVSPAEDSGLPDKSFDLVTVANAVHWFDIPKFYREVTRVLKPGGVIAVWCYGYFEAEKELTDLLQPFYLELDPFWAAPITLVREKYRNLDFPFEELGAPEFSEKVEWTFEQLLGYISSWSAVVSFRSATGRDPVSELRAQWHKSDRQQDDRKFPVKFPLHLRVGKTDSFTQ